MKTLILLLALASTAAAQNIQLKNGKIVTGKALRRDGEWYLERGLAPRGLRRKVLRTHG